MKSDSPEEESDIADSVNCKPYHRLRQKKIKYLCHMVGGFSGPDIRSASKEGMPLAGKGRKMWKIVFWLQIICHTCFQASKADFVKYLKNNTVFDLVPQGKKIKSEITLIILLCFKKIQGKAHTKINVSETKISW